MCSWNTMPPIMANSNEGQDHKDIYFDTSRKILSQEALASYFKKLWTMSIFFCNKLVKWQCQKVKISSQGVFMWYIKALELTV